MHNSTSMTRAAGLPDFPTEVADPGIPGVPDAGLSPVRRVNASVDDSPPPLTVVYSGGGVLGIAYGLGVADALAAGGVPLRDVDALGTSAGAWVASCMATGASHEVLRELLPLRVPNPRPGWLRGVARRVFGAMHDERVRVSAVQLPSMRRQILSGGRFPLADLAAASASVPGLFSPSPVGRSLYWDGVMRSPTSADLAPPARNLLVVVTAPLTGPVLGPVGLASDALLAWETHRWAKATGGSVHVVRPDKKISRLVRHPLDLIDTRLACEVYPMAYEQASRLLETRPALASLASPASPARPASSEQPAPTLLAS
jgi:NTE family protein